MAKLDRRIVKTQQALKKAVIELMGEKHFDAITIQDIADRANVNRGTIYLHYQDKYDLLDKLIEAHISELREMGEWACKLDWSSALEPFFEYFEKNYLFFSPCWRAKEPLLFECGCKILLWKASTEKLITKAAGTKS